MCVCVCVGFIELSANRARVLAHEKASAEAWVGWVSCERVE